MSLYFLLLLHTDEIRRASDEKKRKAVLVSSDSSDVYVLVSILFSCLCCASEIVEIPPSPSKKRARKALPSSETLHGDMAE